MPYEQQRLVSRSKRNMYKYAVIASVVIAALHIGNGFYERQQVLDRRDKGTEYIIEGCREIIVRNSMPDQDSIRGGEIEFKN